MKPGIVQQNLTEAVTKLGSWLSAHGLILNERKSQVLWIPPSKDVNHDLTITCSGIPLPNVTTAKYLGVTFDQGMSWNCHITSKSMAAVKTIGALRRAKNSLTLQARWTFYSAVIMTNILYGSNAFASSLTGAEQEKLVKLQKKALRAIFALPFWAHTAPIRARFQEDCIMDKMHRKLAVLVWRTQNANCSPLLANLFTALSCNRTTRGTTSKALLLPAANRLAGLRRPAFHASVLWNALPAATRMCIVKKRFIESLPPSMSLM